MLTFAAGQLLVFGWHASFAVYLVAFVILAWFLAFVKPLDVVGVQGLETREHVASSQLPQRTDASRAMDGRGWLQSIGAALLAVTFFSANTLNSLRIPTLVVDSGFGSSIAGSTALSCCVFAGFLGGISFGVLSRLLKRWHMAVSAATIAIGMTVIASAGNILLVVVGSMLVGFSTSNGFALVFKGLSLRFRDRALTLANTVALTGCCAGVAATPLHPSDGWDGLAGPFRAFSGVHDSLLFACSRQHHRCVAEKITILWSRAKVCGPRLESVTVTAVERQSVSVKNGISVSSDMACRQ